MFLKWEATALLTKTIEHLHKRVGIGIINNKMA